MILCYIYWTRLSRTVCLPDHQGTPEWRIADADLIRSGDLTLQLPYVPNAGVSTPVCQFVLLYQTTLFFFKNPSSAIIKVFSLFVLFCQPLICQTKKAQ